LSSPALGAGALWSETGLTNIVITTTANKILVPQSSLPTVGAGFFRLGEPKS